MIPVHLDDRAEQDLLEIAQFLANAGRVRAADEFVDAYLSVISQLRRFPESGQASAQDASKRVIRRGVYRFVYELGESDVLLLRIVDGRIQRELP